MASIELTNRQFLLQRMISNAWTIFLKDLKLDYRRVENFFSMLFFSLVILLVFTFALSPEQTKNIGILCGVFWISFLLSGILSLGKSFSLERENSCLDALLISPISRGSIFLGKMLANMAMIIVVQLIVIPIFGVLFNGVVFDHVAIFIFISFMASIGFSSLGTLLAGMTSDIRFKEILLPILLFPLLVPLLLACVKISQSILAGEGLSPVVDWFRLLAGFDLIFLIISYLTFEFVMEV